MSNAGKSPRSPIANIAPFGLRMQPELREKLEEAAVKNARSMNSEITARLNESFQTVCGFSEKEVEALAIMLANRLKAV